jgi:hypothetical protein
VKETPKKGKASAKKPAEKKEKETAPAKKRAPKKKVGHFSPC